MMSSIESAFYDIGTILLIAMNIIFMGITILYIESLWLFILSLILMFVFVGLRKLYNEKWYNEIGYTFSKDGEA